MFSTVIQDRDSKLEEYLQLLRSMSFEMERAMSAISQNSITALEDSLLNQEAFSTRLMELTEDLSKPAHPDFSYNLATNDTGMMRQIRAASDTLQHLNRRYSALLNFSSHSVGLMVSLFSSYQGQLREDSGSRLTVQTWSCQM